MIEGFRNILGRRAGSGKAGPARAEARRPRSRGSCRVELLEGRLLLTTAVNDAFTLAENTPLAVAAPGVLANDSATPTGAVTISPSEALANWSKVEDPYLHYNTDHWSVGGANNGQLIFDFPSSRQSAIGQSLVSGFTQAGDFTFSARVQSIGGDDDIFGLVFGYQDDRHFYRLSFDGGGLKEANGRNGLHLVRENGSDPGTTLFWPTTPAGKGVVWQPGVAYDITVGRTGGTIFLTVDQVGVAGHLLQFSAGDTTFMTGKVGVFTDSQSAQFSNLTYSGSTTAGGSLTAAPVAGPARGTLALNPDGSFTYRPAANYSGPDSFTYKANDGQADSNVATVNLTVTATNRPPVATGDAYTTAEDTPLTIAAPGVLANDTDADGDPLTAVRVAGPAHGTLTLNPNGSFTYTPAGGYSGSDSFTYKANDGRADSNVATVNLTVTPAEGGDTISPTEVLADWSKVPDPYWHYNVDHWSVGGPNHDLLIYDVPSGRFGNLGGALTSDFTASGDFTLSARFQTLGADDDIFGLVFGYRDSNNHYRLSWDGGGFREADGQFGLHLIRESGGVATTLFHPGSPILMWQKNVPYDLTVGRRGNTIFLSIDQVGGGHITDFSITDTTFMSGKVGVFLSSQTAQISNLRYSS